jgi:uncharacterized protein (DUF305 family)
LVLRLPATEVFMTALIRMTITIVVLAGFAGIARAEEAAPQAANPNAFPQACRTAGMPPSDRRDHSSMKSMTGAEHLFMKSMSKMNEDMMQGMVKDDVDMAFICGMIAHHEGAIGMARAELSHGKDAWARQLAQTVIAAQTAEIAAMTEWVEKRASR